MLNAKQHEREAEIIVDAGETGAVTIATNMAGAAPTSCWARAWRISAACTSSAPSGTRRAGSTTSCAAAPAARATPAPRRFYVSLEDDLMRRFGSERIAGMMDKLGVDDDTPIESGLISRSIESAQTKVEGYNFDLRKHVVEYDDVMNKQREKIYEDRAKIVTGENMKDAVLDALQSEIERRGRYAQRRRTSRISMSRRS